MKDTVGLRLFVKISLKILAAGRFVWGVVLKAMLTSARTTKRH